MDRFSKACLFLIALSLVVIAFRPILVPDVARAASNRYLRWLATDQITAAGLNKVMQELQDENCDINAVVPISSTLKNYMGAGSPVGSTGTNEILFVGQCSGANTQSAKPPAKDKKVQ
jgi:hypothetical protein